MSRGTGTRYWEHFHRWTKIWIRYLASSIKQPILEILVVYSPMASTDFFQFLGDKDLLHVLWIRLRFEFLKTFWVPLFGVNNKCFVDWSSPPYHFFFLCSSTDCRFWYPGRCIQPGYIPSHLLHCWLFAWWELQDWHINAAGFYKNFRDGLCRNWYWSRWQNVLEEDSWQFYPGWWTQISSLLEELIQQSVSDQCQ